MTRHLLIARCEHSDRCISSMLETLVQKVCTLIIKVPKLCVLKTLALNVCVCINKVLMTVSASSKYAWLCPHHQYQNSVCCLPAFSLGYPTLLSIPHFIAVYSKPCHVHSNTVTYLNVSKIPCTIRPLKVLCLTNFRQLHLCNGQWLFKSKLIDFGPLWSCKYYILW